MSLEYFKQVKPTYIENWPRQLHDISVPSASLPLSIEDAKRLGQHMVDYWEGFVSDEVRASVNAGEAVQSPPPIEDIRLNVQGRVCTYFRDGAFVRLGSRSPKDSWEGMRNGFKVMPTDRDPLRFLLDASERVADDLQLAIANNYEPHIWVRQWKDIEPWREFRCFMRGRKLIAASQYYYKTHRDGQTVSEVFPEIKPELRRIVRAIKQIASIVATACLDDVIFDVVFEPGGNVNGRPMDAYLLEINPFFELTDPCLFSVPRGEPWDSAIRRGPPCLRWVGSDLYIRHTKLDESDEYDD